MDKKKLGVGYKDRIENKMGDSINVTINSVVPCYKGDCIWPACPNECDGRPGFPRRLTDQKFKEL